jgi:hypothetical protein
MAAKVHVLDIQCIQQTKYLGCTPVHRHRI